MNEREENLARHSAAALQHQEEVEDLKQKLVNEIAARERDKEESIRQMQELREELCLQVALLQVVICMSFVKIFTTVACILYCVQANPGTTTCSQPPNSATLGMNDITPPRVEDEEQEVIKIQHIDITYQMHAPTIYTK